LRQRASAAFGLDDASGQRVEHPLVAEHLRERQRLLSRFALSSGLFKGAKPGDLPVE
jgi:hypothetical protein